MADLNLSQRVLVYKVTCLVTGKEYIGITKRTMIRRWGDHVLKARTEETNSALPNAIRKYGPENFTHEVLFVAFGDENAAMIERELIIEYRTLTPDGYNVSSGGEAYGGHTIIASEGMKAHLRANASKQKGVPLSEEHKARIAASNTGHSVTPERLANMSAGRKGKGLWSEERKAAHAAKVRAWYASEASAEWRENRPEVAKRRVSDPDYLPRTGWHHSEETRAKIGQSGSETKQKQKADRANVSPKQLSIDFTSKKYTGESDE